MLLCLLQSPMEEPLVQDGLLPSPPHEGLLMSNPNVAADLRAQRPTILSNEQQLPTVTYGFTMEIKYEPKGLNHTLLTDKRNKANQNSRALLHTIPCCGILATNAPCPTSKERNFSHTIPCCGFLATNAPYPTLNRTATPMLPNFRNVVNQNVPTCQPC